MAKEVTVALDAMGSDSGPSVVVEGAVRFFKYCPSKVTDDVSIILTGDRDCLTRYISKFGGTKYPIEIVHASQIVTMNDSPAQVLREKRDSSMAIMANLQKEGKAQAMVSPGNTGAMMAASIFALGRIKGIPRPALAGTFPSMNNPTTVLDVGANVGCKTEQLVQFAIMGDAYARGVFGIEKPRIALLNVGAERTKGTEIIQEIYKILEESHLNFTGNIEGDGILKGESDVVICDGFTGNVVLKTFESIAELIGGTLYGEMKRHWSSRAGYLLMRHSFAKLWEKLDSAEYGGVPLLGLKGTSIVAHGSASPKAIKNAVVAACDCYRGGVAEKIQEEISKLSEQTDGGESE